MTDVRQSGINFMRNKTTNIVDLDKFEDNIVQIKSTRVNNNTSVEIKNIAEDGNVADTNISP